jgi:hypothetical protein
LVLVDKNRETWGEAGREKLLFADEKIKLPVKLDEKSSFWWTRRSKLRVELDENSSFRWMTKEKLRWGEVGREWLVLVDGKIKTSGVKLDESGWFWRTRKSRLRGDVGRESLVFRDEKGGTSTEVGREWLV